MLSLQLQKIDDNYFSFFLVESQEQVASLYFVIHEKETHVFIENMCSKYPGRRLGSYLLLQLCDYILKNYPRIRWIKLDDCTMILPPKNIYYKLGFQVKDEKRKNNFCSWNTWLEKYNHVKPNPSEERRILTRVLMSNLKNFFSQQT